MKARTPTDAERIAGIREMVEAAKPGDLLALWSAEADFRWLLSKVEAASEAAPVVGLDLRAALERIFSLDSHKGAVVVRSTPGNLADEVIRELEAMGLTQTRTLGEDGAE